MHVLSRVALALSVVFVAGCKIADGTNVQTSGVGAVFEPLGSSPSAPRVSIGSIANSYSTPAPADAGPTLNRVGVNVRGMSIDHTATIAQGPIGEQLEAAGESLPDVLDKLHPPADTVYQFPGGDGP